FDAGQQPDRAEIDVLPEAAADRDQQAPERDMVGNAGISDRAEEDPLRALDLLEPILRHHRADLGIALAAPIVFAPAELEPEASARRFEYAHALRHHFLADPVPRNDRDLVTFRHGTSPPSLSGPDDSEAPAPRLAGRRSGHARPDAPIWLDGDRALEIGHAAPGNGDAFPLEGAGQRAAAARDLPRREPLLAEPLRPVRRQHAMRRARHRILVDPMGRREEARDEIDTTLSRRAGDEVAMALAAERGEIRREPRHFLGAGEEGEIAIAAAMQLAGRRAKRRGELR